jgi:hypothetical protein
MSDTPKTIDGEPVLAEARIVRRQGFRMRCECGSYRWDVLREYNRRTNWIVVILGLTVILLPFLMPFHIRNQGVYACCECGTIYKTGAAAKADEADAVSEEAAAGCHHH